MKDWIKQNCGKTIAVALDIIVLLVLYVDHEVARQVSNEVAGVRKEVADVKTGFTDEMEKVNGRVSKLVDSGTKTANAADDLDRRIKELAGVTDSLNVRTSYVEVTKADQKQISKLASKTHLAAVEKKIDDHLLAQKIDESLTDDGTVTDTPAQPVVGAGKLIIETHVVPRQTAPIPHNEDE